MLYINLILQKLRRQKIMAEQRVTGSSQRNAKDVAYELTELYYTTVVDKEKVKEASPEEVAETYMKIYNKITGVKQKN